jgi:phospholipase/carboxylesterase
MKPISSTLVHRVLPPEERGAQIFPTLILLHGRGADEDDLMGLAQVLDDRLLIISARAPFPYPYGGYTWYDVGTIGTPEPEMFRTSCDRLHRFITDVRSSYPADPSKVFLLGFSMGCVMSFAMALTAPELVRGVSANSGYIPEGTHLAFRWGKLQNVAFFITHGTTDPVIPVEFARRARTLFEQSRAQVEYREYPVGHQLSDSAVTETAAWITRLIDGQG